AAGCGLVEKGDIATVGRPRWTRNRIGMSREPEGCAGADQFDVDILMVVLFSSPSESERVALGRECRSRFLAAKTGEGNVLEGRFRLLRRIKTQPRGHTDGGDGDERCNHD